MSLVPPGPNTFVFLAGDSRQMCIDIQITDDDEQENNEMFTTRFDLNPLLGGFMDGRFRYDPNVTEIVIIDNDQGKKYLRVHHFYIHI